MNGTIYMPVGEVCSSISDTYREKKNMVTLINTSDVLEGRVLNHERVPNSNLKGQFKKTFQRDDILYSEIRPQNRRFAYVDFSPIDYIASTKLMVIRAKKDVVSPKYLYYFLKNSSTVAELQLLAETRSGTFPQITFSEVANLTIPVPSLAVQEVIVQTMQCLEDKITCNEQINDNLEQQAKLIYDYWFTQFDFPDENGKPYCSSGGKMVWNEQLKRNIPENWNVVPLLKLVSWESNSQPPKSEFVYEPKEGYVRFIQNRDYDSDTHITYIPRTKNLSIVDRFDILMDKYGDAGAVRYGIEGAFNVALGKICVHNPNYREYIRSFLGSDGIYKFLHNSCMASTRASLSEANLAILNVVVPDEKIILDYENFLHKIRVSILKNKDETVELINLRDWLLPMLMNGQATIAD